MPIANARAPRILVCTDTYPPQLNGVSVVTSLSVGGLAERGWECAVVAPRYPGDRDSAVLGSAEDGSRLHATLPSVAAPVYPDLRLAMPWYPTVHKAVSAFRPDLIHCATEFVIGRLGQVAARRRGIPLVSSYHTDFGRYMEAYGASRLAPMVRRHLRRFHRRSERVFTPSSASARDLAALGVEAVEIWGRGVDMDRFHPARRSPELRESFGMGSRFTFLYVGRFAAEKNVELILEAYARASAQVPPGVVHLIMAGAGPREPVLRAIAPAGVSFLGPLDRASTLPNLYANADAFVFASETETLGLVVLEAMASGLPVVAAPAGGVADHLRHGVNGLAFPPGDVDEMARGMLDLVSDPMRLPPLREGARRTAEALSWSAELDGLDRSYRQVLERSPVRPTRDHRRARGPFSVVGS
jgi:glycosyltransferase involved in cell wall biosynthesis